MNEIEVIAEIGINHDGSVAAAEVLIEAAMKAGANTVKTQLYNAERVYPRERWDEMKRYELSVEDIAHLKHHATLLGMRFLCTPDDIEDARALKAMGVDRIKIGSSNITNEPLLCEVASYKLPVILSTGACEWGEMARAVSILRNVPLTIMHCISAYPAPSSQMNLLVIRQLYKRFRRPVGLSDHSLDYHTALVALGLGARVFEKHFTFDRGKRGPDHSISLDPILMAHYVDGLRRGAQSLGNGVKTVMPCELHNRIEYDRFVAQQREAACLPS